MNNFWPIPNFREYYYLENLSAEITYPWQILDLIKNQILNKLDFQDISNAAEISSSAIIEGPVIIKKGAKVLHNTKIIGPAIIGEDTIIGDCTLIRESIIASNCVIGFLTDIARSFIGYSNWLSRTHIADSILGNNINIGGGSVITSLRLDNQPIKVNFNSELISTDLIKFGTIVGDYTQLGANVMTMPGILIGKNSIVGSGVIVKQNIEDGVFCKLIQNIEFRVNNKILPTSIRQELRNSLKM